MAMIVTVSFTPKMSAVRWTLKKVEKLYYRDVFFNEAVPMECSELIKVPLLQNVLTFAKAQDESSIIDALEAISDIPRLEVIAMEILTVCDESESYEEVLHNLEQLIRFYKNMRNSPEYQRELLKNLRNYASDLKSERK